MAKSPPDGLTVGDPMPRILLPEATGTLFDSWHQTAAGMARAYWLGPPPTASAEAQLASTLAACETELRVVAAAPPEVPDNHPSWLLDPAGKLGRTVGATGPLAIVVDALGRLAALLPAPTPDGIAVVATRLYMASAPVVVQAQAPVLLLERLVEPTLCQALMEHWWRGDKLAGGVASVAGASVADTEVKRRQDVPLDDVRLYGQLRDCLVRRLMPAILQAFQTRIVQIEAPRIGCYDAGSGGWFRRHRDNTTTYTAHRQFALSLNLNAADEYDGAALRFPEFGRQLYRPPAGGGLVFSCALLHEVMPVTRGRRFGVFTFLHDESHDAQYRRLIAAQKALGITGITMRDAGGG
jgi:predicted 2-oxoglutarate/Fe(II)-dependent dioxygenase YbiX